RSGLAAAAAVPLARVPPLRPGSVAVVGQGLDHDRGAARAITLVDRALDRRGVRSLPGPAVNRPLDVLLRHRRVTRLLDGEAERWVGVDVAAAVAGGDGDRARELREELAALGVGGALLVLDRGPLRVTGHSFDSRRGPGTRTGRPRAPCSKAADRAASSGWSR